MNSGQDKGWRKEAPPLQGRGKGWGMSVERLAELHGYAREMRHQPTEAEKRLWRHILRGAHQSTRGAPVIDRNASLRTLQDHFLATSTVSMPVAGLIFWAAAGLVGMQVPPASFGMIVLIGTGMVFPLGYAIDRLRGRNFMAAGRANPLTVMFTRSITMVALMFPLVIIAAREAGDPIIVVLGAAILSGIVWIPYGWAADDPVGLRHAIARSVLCYAAYLLAPAPLKGTAICVVVALSYLYSLTFMRKPGADAVH